MSPNAQETADLVTFTEKILNGKLHFSKVIPCLRLRFPVATGLHNLGI